MLDIDFVAGSNSDPDSTSSYDAITLRFKEDGDENQIVVVIDGGFSDTGNDVVNHLAKHYGTDKVDLMISTHPDRDHLNGLITAIQQLEVKELWIHQPDTHTDDLSEFTNLDNLNTLLAFAEDQGVTITEPFAGTSNFGGRILALSPTNEYYEELLREQLDPEVKAAFASSGTANRFASAISNLFERALTHLPIETLGNGGKTHPRNNSSVITLLSYNSKRYMFTGDAGIPALEAAADCYESNFGEFSNAPLAFFQAPHHGSKRNVGADILNRILGQHGQPHNPNFHAFIHAAKASTKHPSPKVTNALIRRGCKQDSLAVTQGFTKHHSHNSPDREGWSSITPYPILPEES